MIIHTFSILSLFYKTRVFYESRQFLTIISVVKIEKKDK